MLSRRTISVAVVLGLVATGSFYGIPVLQVVPNGSVASASESTTATGAASSNSTALIITTASEISSGSSSRTSTSESASAITQAVCFGSNNVNDSLILESRGFFE